MGARPRGRRGGGRPATSADRGDRDRPRRRAAARPAARRPIGCAPGTLPPRRRPLARRAARPRARRASRPARHVRPVTVRVREVVRPPPVIVSRVVAVRSGSRPEVARGPRGRGRGRASRSHVKGPGSCVGLRPTGSRPPPAAATAARDTVDGPSMGAVPLAVRCRMSIPERVVAEPLGSRTRSWTPSRGRRARCPTGARVPPPERGDAPVGAAGVAGTATASTTAAAPRDAATAARSRTAAAAPGRRFAGQ